MVGWVEALIFRDVEVSIIAIKKGFSENHDQAKPRLLAVRSNNLLKLLPMPRIWRTKLTAPRISDIAEEIQKVNPDKAVVRFELDLTSVKYLIAARMQRVPVFVYTQWPVARTPIFKKYIIFFLVKVLKMPTFSPVFQFSNPILGVERIETDNKIKFDQDLRNRITSQSLIKLIPFTLSESFIPKEANVLEEQKESVFQFVTIGKFMKRKNLSMLVEAFCKNSLFMNSNSELIVIGECTTEEHFLIFESLIRILQINKAAGKIHILRNLSHKEVEEFLRKSQVFLLQSSAEPASISVLEAMKNANLLILDPTSGTADYAGINYGALPSSSRDDLDQCLNRVLGDRNLVKRIQARNEQTYNEHFSSKIIGDLLYNFLFERQNVALSN